MEKVKNTTKSESNDLMKLVGKMSDDKVLLDEKFQKKLIKIIIEDDSFSEQVIDLLKEDYFDGIMSRSVMNYILGYFSKYNTVPKYDTLVNIINEREKDENTRNCLKEFLSLTEQLKLADRQYVKDYTLNFCKKQSLRRGIEKAAVAWANEDYENIHKIITDSMKAGEGRETGHNYIDDVEKRLIRDIRNPVPVLEGFNQKIGGGLAGGELGVVLAPTGGGKSMLLVKFGCSALLAGKTVVYYSLELAERAIANRFDSCLTGIKLSEILQFPQAIKEKVQEIQSLGGNLIIKEFPTGGASVNSVRAHLKSMEASKIIPDVIFIDYADIMKPLVSFNEKRFALTSIYEGIRALSMELNIPIWTASQASRTAINESKFDLRSISESLGKAQTADVILGLGRSDDDKAAKLAKLMVLKNRNGADGYDLNLFFDTTNIEIYLQETDNFHGVNGLGMAVNSVENLIKLNKQLPEGPPLEEY